MKHRIFIALDLPDSLIQQITALQNKLDALKYPVTWEKPNHLHLTLNFLGRLTDEQSYPVFDFLRGVSRTIPPFTLTPQFLQTLYKRHEPSIIYLSVAGEDLPILKSLRKQLCAGLINLKIPQPFRFLPHITIGRTQRTDPVATKSCLDRITDISTPVFSPFPVDHLSVYESLVSANGTHYQPVRNFVLG